MIEKELLENPSPWMNDYAVAYYESIMRPAMRILEWGAGYSTIWLEKFDPAYLVSIEHNKDWADALEPYLTTTDLRKVDTYPKNFVNEWEEQSFDLIIIDGINRLKCLYWVLDHNLLAEGGIIIYDDMHRKWSQQDYIDAWEVLEDEDFKMVMQPNSTLEDRLAASLDGNKLEDKDITLFAHRVK